MFDLYLYWSCNALCCMCMVNFRNLVWVYFVFWIIKPDQTYPVYLARRALSKKGEFDACVTFTWPKKSREAVFVVESNYLRWKLRKWHEFLCYTTNSLWYRGILILRIMIVYMLLVLFSWELLIHTKLSSIFDLDPWQRLNIWSIWSVIVNH